MLISLSKKSRELLFKRELKFKHYGRYVDDFYIIETSKERLLNAVPLINDFLRTKLELSLHPRKIYLQEAKRGVRFLGSYITPYYTRVDKRSYNRSLVLWYETISTTENLSLVSTKKVDD